jgi:hypothetical protein
MSELPLQTLLWFFPCPAPLATSYLQSLALAEGYLIDRGAVEKLYASTYAACPADIPDVPLHPFSSPLPVPDLRRAIHNLQLRCYRGETGEKGKEPMSLEGLNTAPPGQLFVGTVAQTDDIQAFRRLYRTQKHTDTRSFVDAYLLRRPQDVMEVRMCPPCRHGL